MGAARHRHAHSQRRDAPATNPFLSPPRRGWHDELHGQGRDAGPRARRLAGPHHLHEHRLRQQRARAPRQLRRKGLAQLGRRLRCWQITAPITIVFVWPTSLRRGVMSEHKHTNRLIIEPSPYLLQHAHYPVDWYPWDSEALAKSREEDKPILLSVGYAACHWCH